MWSSLLTALICVAKKNPLRGHERSGMFCSPLASHTGLSVPSHVVCLLCPDGSSGRSPILRNREPPTPDSALSRRSRRVCGQLIYSSSEPAASSTWPNVQSETAASNVIKIFQTLLSLSRRPRQSMKASSGTSRVWGRWVHTDHTFVKLAQVIIFFSFPTHLVTRPVFHLSVATGQATSFGTPNPGPMNTPCPTPSSPSPPLFPGSWEGS